MVKDKYKNCSLTFCLTSANFHRNSENSGFRRKQIPADNSLSVFMHSSDINH